ncbi:hypothetical protein WJW27_004745 [Escherichia coli]|nr:hypothetical protein vBEcoMphAPEC6_01285 [Escherichia phage ph0011]
MALRGQTQYKCIEEIRKKDGTLFDRKLKQEYKDLRDVIRNESFGGKRRQKIYEFLKNGLEIQVNGLHCVQTKNDPDILRLLKEGKIEMFNTPISSYGNRLKCKHTYLRIKNG